MAAFNMDQFEKDYREERRKALRDSVNRGQTSLPVAVLQHGANRIGEGVSDTVRGIGSFAKSLYENPQEVVESAATGLDDLYSRIAQGDPMAALQVAGNAATGGTLSALLRGGRLDPTAFGSGGGNLIRGFHSTRKDFDEIDPERGLPTGNFGQAAYFSSDQGYPSRLNPGSRIIEADLDPTDFLQAGQRVPVAKERVLGTLSTLTSLEDATGQPFKVQYNSGTNTARVEYSRRRRAGEEGPIAEVKTLDFNDSKKFFADIKSITWGLRYESMSTDRTNLSDFMKAAGFTGVKGGSDDDFHIGVFDKRAIRSGNAPSRQSFRDGLPVERLVDYDNTIRDTKNAMLNLQGLKNRMGSTDENPFDIVDDFMAAEDQAAKLLSNNRSGVSLSNSRTNAVITPSSENPGKFRISYLDRKSKEPMGDTENFDTMEAAIRDALNQGYVNLERFEPKEFAEGGEVMSGIGSLNETARGMTRGPRGIGSYVQYMANGGEIDKNFLRKLVKGVVMAESSGDLRAENKRSGALGLMQIRPSTARDPGYSVENVFTIAKKLGYETDGDESDGMVRQLLFIPEINVELGTQYLQAMLKKFPRTEDALRAYNAGPGKFAEFKASGKPISALSDENRNYPLKVVAGIQGLNPNEPREMAAFNQSPETLSSIESVLSPPTSDLMMFEGPSSARVNPIYDALGPRPVARPTPAGAAEVQIDQITGQPVVVPPSESLYEKYSPENMAQEAISGIGGLSGTARDMFR